MGAPTPSVRRPRRADSPVGKTGRSGAIHTRGMRGWFPLSKSRYETHDGRLSLLHWPLTGSPNIINKAVSAASSLGTTGPTRTRARGSRAPASQQAMAQTVYPQTASMSRQAEKDTLGVVSGLTMPACCRCAQCPGHYFFSGGAPIENGNPSPASALDVGSRQLFRYTRCKPAVVTMGP